jgi:hypothetical protein
MVNPSGDATEHGQMTRALVASISDRKQFLWDDFWPSNGQIKPWRSRTVSVRPFSEFFGGVCCGFCDARSPIL